MKFRIIAFLSNLWKDFMVTIRLLGLRKHTNKLQQEFLQNRMFAIKSGLRSLSIYRTVGFVIAGCGILFYYYSQTDRIGEIRNFAHCVPKNIEGYLGNTERYY